MVKSQSALANCLVPLRSSDHGTPLYCIHPSGGDIGIYRKLVRNLCKGYPVFGIQSRLAAGDDEEFPTMEAMASHYAQLIVEQHPQGPVRLLGFSFGGFVASRISSLLIQLGREVTFLGLIDSDLRWMDDDAVTARKTLKLRLKQLSIQFQEIGIFNRVPREQLDEHVDEIVANSLGPNSDLSSTDMIEYLQSRGYLSSQSPPATTLSHFVSRFLTHCNLIRNSKMGAIDSPMKLWWPSDSDEIASVRRRSWQSHSKHDIVERVLEGSHYSIMRMPTVRTLANQVSMDLGESPVSKDLARN